MASATSQLANVEPNRPLTDAERYTAPLPIKDWSDTRAAAIARGNLEIMEQSRMTMGHVRRWAVADELYLAWQPQKVWEGTRIPRASMGVYITMREVEALMAAVMPAIFPLMENVEVQPRAGSSWDEARAVFALLMTQFDSLGEHGYGKLREEFRKAIKQAYVYGNGILEASWLYSEIERKRYIPEWVQDRTLEPDPITGQLFPRPVGPPRRELRETRETIKINQPLLRSVDVRDFFIDPNCTSPDVQNARFCATRHLMTVADIQALRSDKRFKIPIDKVLIDMAAQKGGQINDQQKNTTETFRNGSWVPQNDYTENPAHKRLEVIRYWERDRCVWLLNRNWVAYNGANDYGCLPFLNAFYVDVPNRFYGLAITDIVEGDQRYIQTIRNARADELALSIHAPFIKKRGTMMTQSSLRVAPGKVIEVETPKEDLIRMEMGNITQNAYIEEEVASRAVQQNTGNSDLAILGTPTQGGNSANRTAAGINTQAAATGKRIQQIVENLESSFIEPLLVMVHGMNQRFLSREQVVQILGPDGRFYAIDPLYVVNANVKFSIKAGERMRNRAMLLQTMQAWLPLIMNPEVLQMQAKVGMTLDMNEVLDSVFDAINVSSRKFFRQMTPQEMQMMQAPPPEMMARASMMQMQQGAKMQMQQQGDDTKLLQTAMDKLITPDAAHQVLGLEAPAAIEAKHAPKPAKPAAKKK